ncbi:MAG: hypothetical protein QM791_03795 [Ferruginibacter sp.]
MQKITDINQGDLLTFKATDNKYKALLCTSTYKDKSPQNFTFAALTYDSLNKPTVSNILDTEFFGIGNTNNDYFKYSEIELDKMWTIHPETKPYILGSYGLIIWRKDFMKFRDNFEVIGNLKIVNNLDKNGNGSMNASGWTSLNQFFSDNYVSVLSSRGQRPFKLKSVLIN